MLARRFWTGELAGCIHQTGAKRRAQAFIGRPEREGPRALGNPGDGSFSITAKLRKAGRRLSWGLLATHQHSTSIGLSIAAGRTHCQGAANVDALRMTSPTWRQSESDGPFHRPIFAPYPINHFEASRFGCPRIPLLNPNGLLPEQEQGGVGAGLAKGKQSHDKRAAEEGLGPREAAHHAQPQQKTLEDHIIRGAPPNLS